MAKVLLLLANGFEEIEAVTVIDIVRRAEIQVTTASIDNELKVIGSHEIALEADTLLGTVYQNPFDMIVLPGGEPGTTHLQKDPLVKRVLQDQYQKNGHIAAICAAPRVFDEWGFLDKKKGTCHPSQIAHMTHCDYCEESVVIADKVITSRGAGTASAFAFSLIGCLLPNYDLEALKQAMLY